MAGATTAAAAPAALAPAGVGVAPRLDALWCALLALAGYLLLGQQTLYSVDGHLLLWISRHGDTVHRYHFSYLPLLGVFRDVWAACGGSLYSAALALSAVGAAAGAALAHAAGRTLGMSRRQALQVTALVAASPGIVFFATVVEVHGAFLLSCGWTWLAAAGLAVRPGPRRGAWLGAATVLGFSAHSTGALLPAVAVPCALAAAWPRGRVGRPLWLGLGVALAVHAAGVVLLPRALQWAGVLPAPGQPLRWLVYLDAMLADPAQLVATAWEDWLRPGLLPSAVAVAAWFVPRARPWAAATGAAAAVYVFFTCLVIGARTERGAYLLPLAWPAAVACALALPRRGVVVAAAATAALAVADVVAHDRADHAAFAAGFRRAIGDRPAFVIAGGHDEVGAFFVQLPDVDFHLLTNELHVPAASVAAALPIYDQWLRGKIAGGSELWLTAGAVDTLTDERWTGGRPAGPALLQHLRDHWEWRPSGTPGFAAWRLVPRR